MIDLLLVIAFIALPVGIWLVTRSLAWSAIAIAFAFGVGGNAVQALVALGMPWSVRGLQVLSLALLVGVLAIALLTARRRTSVRRQVLVIGLPVVIISVFLLAMRLLAPGNPGALTAVGYLVNHPQAEDNAKWLHLTAQLADGRDLVFSGYAGGPLLLLLAVVASLVSVLSLWLLGGHNEVAIAANTLVITQFALIAFVPFALAPLAQARLRIGSAKRTLPLPTIWASIFVLFLASAVITSFGHLSLRFVLILAGLWATTFLAGYSARARLLTTLTIAMAASVWLPLNVLGLVLIVGCLIWAIRARNWLGAGLAVLAGVVAWDAIMSSLLFLLGFSSSGENLSTEELGNVGTGLPDSVAVASSLFTAPGGVEKIAPLVGALTLASVLFAVWLLVRDRVPGHRSGAVAFLPIALLGGYLVAIEVLDAVTTASAPHYGGHKLAFLAVITALVATLPIALTGLSAASHRMTTLQWAGIGAVVVLLSVDTIMPRAISALSPMLWPSVNADAPQYWSAAEVRPVPEQSLSSLPIVCLSAPPARPVPTALPLGQESYSCTRLLIGLAGMEGKTGLVTNWLQTDWASGRENWDEVHEVLSSTTEGIRSRSVILMGDDESLAGLTTFGQLLDRYRPVNAG